MVKITGQSNTGPQGLPGTNGTNGVDGLSAYEVAVANGFVGTEAEWVASLEGPTGPQGPPGPVSSVDGLTGAVDLTTKYQAIGNYAPAIHTHVAADITSGTFPATAIPNLDAAKLTTGIFDAARIPNLDAAKIATGILDAARLPTHAHAAGDVTSGTFADARIPSLNASKITAGTLSLGRIPTGTTSSTVALGNRGIPNGGTTAQALVKFSATDYVTQWYDMPTPSIRSGQSSGHVGLTANTTIVTVTTPVLKNGVYYTIEATGWLEGYGGGGVASTGRPIIDIDGNAVTMPVDLTFEGNIDGPKMQHHYTTITGAGTAINVNLNYVHATGSTSINWAKLVVRSTPVY